MAIGRISGPLLKSNLVRDGVDLAFETDLLYLDVTNARVGVNTNSPTTDLDINGTTQTVTARVDNQLTVGNLTLENNNITSSTNIIDFTAAAGEATVYHSRLNIDDIEIQGNKIATVVSNSNLELQSSASGTIELLSDTNITGNLNISGTLDVTGTITIGGNIIIGDESTDTITINASIQSDLIPETDNAYDLGSPSYKWKDIYVNNFYTTSFNIPELDIGQLSFRDNTISTPAGVDMYLEGNASGGVRLGNFKFNSNTITNVIAGAVSEFAQTGTGYWKINGTNGFVPPVGDDAQRPTAYAVVGMTRYNTNSKSLEIWTGTTWASPAGASGAVSETDANEIATIYSLMLG
jgi:hypothetical protein